MMVFVMFVRGDSGDDVWLSYTGLLDERFPLGKKKEPSHDKPYGLRSVGYSFRFLMDADDDVLLPIGLWLVAQIVRRSTTDAAQTPAVY
jgi:hypothetical protein